MYLFIIDLSQKDNSAKSVLMVINGIPFSSPFWLKYGFCGVWPQLYASPTDDSLWTWELHVRSIFTWNIMPIYPFEQYVHEFVVCRCMNTGIVT